MVPLTGAAANFTAIKYGGQVQHKVQVLTLGASVISMLAPDADRLGILLVNTSTDLVYVGFDEQVSSSRGIYLAPNGGSLGIQADEDMTLPTLGLYGLSSAASSDILALTLRRFKANDMGDA